MGRKQIPVRGPETQKQHRTDNVRSQNGKKKDNIFKKAFRGACLALGITYAAGAGYATTRAVEVAEAYNTYHSKVEQIERDERRIARLQREEAQASKIPFDKLPHKAKVDALYYMLNRVAADSGTVVSENVDRAWVEQYLIGLEKARRILHIRVELLNAMICFENGYFERYAGIMVVDNNFGGQMNRGHLMQFATVAQGMDAYIETMRSLNIMNIKTARELGRRVAESGYDADANAANGGAG